MTKLCTFVGMFVGSYAGWFIAAPLGFWWAFIVSGIGSVVGVYLGWKLARHLEREPQDLAGWLEVVSGTGDGGHYLIMSFAARWIGGEPKLNYENDDFKWLAPGGLGDLKVTGGLQEVIDAARRLVGS